MQLTLYMEHLDKTFTNYASEAADAARERRAEARRASRSGGAADVKALSQARAHLGPMLVNTMSHSVSLSMWGEQLHSKVLQARDMARVVCGDIKAFSGIKHKADTLVEDIRSWLDEQFVAWQSDTIEDIEEGRCVSRGVYRREEEPSLTEKIPLVNDPPTHTHPSPHTHTHTHSAQQSLPRQGRLPHRH